MKTNGSEFSINRNHLTWLIFAACSAYLVAYLIYFSRWPIDDSFITMRVARNFLFFGKPYFNIDDPVLGSSTHIWVLLLSASFAIFRAKTSVVLGLEILITLLLFHFSAEIFRERFSRNISLLLAFLVVHLTALPFGALLRETPLVLLFFCLTILSIRKRSYFYAGIFSALAVFTRNEFVIFAALLILLHRKEAMFWVGQATIAIPMLAFILFYFHTVVPQALAAKALYCSIPPLEKAMQMLLPGSQVQLESEGEKVFSVAPNAFPSLAFNLAFPAVLVLIAGLLLWRWHRKDNLLGSIAAFPLLLFACYTVNAAWIPIWYWPHVVFPLFLWGVLQFRRELWVSLAFLLACSGHIAQQWNDFKSLITRQAEMHSLASITTRTAAYLDIGRQLSEMKLDCKSIYATEIGALGWSYSGPITDGLGLVSSIPFRELQQSPNPNRKMLNLNTLLPIIKNDPPCFIVSVPFLIKHQHKRVELQNELQAKYRLLSTTPLAYSYMGDTDVYVWQRLGAR